MAKNSDKFAAIDNVDIDFVKSQGAAFNEQLEPLEEHTKLLVVELSSIYFHMLSQGRPNFVEIAESIKTKVMQSYLFKSKIPFGFFCTPCGIYDEICDTYYKKSISKACRAILLYLIIIRKQLQDSHFLEQLENIDQHVKKIKDNETIKKVIKQYKGSETSSDSSLIDGPPEFSSISSKSSDSNKDEEEFETHTDF